jgi:hypothetical protein
VYWLRAVDPALASIVHEARIDTDRETLCTLLDISLEELPPDACFELEPEDARALVQHFQLDFPVGDLPVELHPWHPNDDLPYRVHTGRELALMLAGAKPLAVFVDWDPSAEDERIFPTRAFEPHVASGRLVKREVAQPPGPGALIVQGRPVGMRRVLYAVREEAWRIEAYLLLWATAEKSGWNAGFERMEGSLLGYEDWQNDVHIAIVIHRGRVIAHSDDRTFSSGTPALKRRATVGSRGYSAAAPLSRCVRSIGSRAAILQGGADPRRATAAAGRRPASRGRYVLVAMQPAIRAAIHTG